MVGSADDAGHGREHRAHDRHRQREGAGHTLQQHLDAVQKIVGDAAALHHHAHEDEGGYRHQHQILRCLPPDAGQEIKKFDEREGTHEVADETVEERQAAEDECHRKSGKQKNGQGQEHEDRQVVLHGPEKLFLLLGREARYVREGQPDDYQNDDQDDRLAVTDTQLE